MLISEAYELLQPIDHCRCGLRKARCLRIQNNSYRVGVHPGDDGKVLVDFIRSPIHSNVRMRGMRRKVVDYFEVHQLVPNSQRALGDRDSCTVAPNAPAILNDFINSNVTQAERRARVNAAMRDHRHGSVKATRFTSRVTR